MDALSDHPDIDLADNIARRIRIALITGVPLERAAIELIKDVREYDKLAAGFTGGPLVLAKNE